MLGADEPVNEASEHPRAMRGKSGKTRRVGATANRDSHDRMRVL